MNMNEVFSCPCCTGKATQIISAGALLSPVVTNTFSCKDCGAQWRAYWLVAEQCIEMLSTGSSSETLELTDKVAL